MKSRLAFRRHAGFSLIELLVSMTIGLIATLAITIVLTRSEGSKRSTTSVNDINQTGSYVAFVVDRAIRNAGTGFSQNWSTTYGCLLKAARSGSQVLPPSFAASTPFAGVTTAAMPIRLAPVIIGKGLAAGTGGDVLMVMSGTAGASEVPLAVTPGSVTSTQLTVTNTLGYRADNIVLLADPSVSGCMIQQVGPTFGSAPQVVPLAGTYFSATVDSTTLTSFGGNTVMAQLGVNDTNPPQFQLFAVGENNSLFSYDLLEPAGTAQRQVADGVVEMRALYGLDTTLPPDGVIDAFVDPIAGSGYEASVLLNGSAASQRLLRQIVAIRLGFILRTALEERAPASVTNPEGYLQPAGTTLTLFGDTVDAGGTSISQTRTLSGSDLRHRFRTIEVTIPLINVQSAPQL
jgi:type IV pilus assembly protein PilW